MAYIPHSKNELKQIFEDLKISNIDELFQDIPKEISNPDINIDNAISEIECATLVKNLAKKNNISEFSCFLGAGAYNHYIPSPVNTITSRSEFITAYTPYQPEMSQGILQAIFEFQSMICALTELEISNASLYDGATALWEAILMAVRITKRKNVIVYEPIHPNYKEVLKTYAKFEDINISFTSDVKSMINKDTSAVVASYPNFFGVIEDLSWLGDIAKKNQSIFICNVNPIALGLFETPANMGAEIIVGEAQSLGIPLSFGGPYLGIISASNKFMRQMPGRIVGQTTDINGKTAYTLTLQTREQHIRREKATSNICSNQALMALAVSVYLSYMGKTGLNTIAKICYDKCIKLKQALNVKTTDTHFNEFVLDLAIPARKFIAKCFEKKLIPGYDLGLYDKKMENKLLVCVTEMNTAENIEKLLIAHG